MNTKIEVVEDIDVAIGEANIPELDSLLYVVGQFRTRVLLLFGLRIVDLLAKRPEHGLAVRYELVLLLEAVDLSHQTVEDKGQYHYG